MTLNTYLRLCRTKAVRHLWLLLILLPMMILPMMISSLEATPRPQGAVQCLALTLYWEARSEGRQGMIAVGWVVLNRVQHDKFPDTVCAVVKQGGETPPCAWSWWCDGRSDRPRNPKAWELAQTLARRLLHHPPRDPDPTQGALWFHHVSIKKPQWAQVSQRTVRIGKHIFYRERPGK